MSLGVLKLQLGGGVEESFQSVGHANRPDIANQEFPLESEVLSQFIVGGSGAWSEEVSFDSVFDDCDLLGGDAPPQDQVVFKGGRDHDDPVTMFVQELGDCCQRVVQK